MTNKPMTTRDEIEPLVGAFTLELVNREDAGQLTPLEVDHYAAGAGAFFGFLVSNGYAIVTVDSE